MILPLLIPVSWIVTKFTFIETILAYTIAPHGKIICNICIYQPEIHTLESAKLRALRAHVPTCLAYLTCSRANVPCVPYVLTSQRVLCAYVLTCNSVLRAYVLTCQRALRAYLLTCFACLLVDVPCVLKCSNANVLMCLRALSSLFHLPASLPDY